MIPELLRVQRCLKLAVNLPDIPFWRCGEDASGGHEGLDEGAFRVSEVAVADDEVGCGGLKRAERAEIVAERDGAWCDLGFGDDVPECVVGDVFCELRTRPGRERGSAGEAEGRGGGDVEDGI